MGSAELSGNRSTAPNRAATLAVAGVVFYVLIDVLLAILRPGLSLLHNAESDYGVGPFSWLMDINFLVRCLLSLALVVALARLLRGPTAQLGLWLVGVWAVGSGILAFFPDDPPGYPVTSAGKVHLAVAAIAFLCVAIGTIVLALEAPRLPALAPIAGWLLGVAVVAVLPLLLLGSTHFHAHSLDGLYERIFLALELLWLLLVGIRLRRNSALAP